MGLELSKFASSPANRVLWLNLFIDEGRMAVVITIAEGEAISNIQLLSTHTMQIASISLWIRLTLHRQIRNLQSLF